MMSEGSERQRNAKGQFVSKIPVPLKKPRKDRNIVPDHNYICLKLIDKIDSNDSIKDPRMKTILLDAQGQAYLVPGAGGQWKVGRRIVEWNVLLDNLQSCPVCRMGPIPLTKDSLVGELQKGLSGYIYVRCGNNDCQAVVRAAYGKTHHMKKKGMPCFVVNTKLGTGNYSSQTTLIIFPDVQLYEPYRL